MVFNANEIESVMNWQWIWVLICSGSVDAVSLETTVEHFSNRFLKIRPVADNADIL